MKVRHTLFLLLILLAPSLVFAGVGLKPGPQLWVYSIRGDVKSIHEMVDKHSFDKKILGRALYHTIRRSKSSANGKLTEAVKTFLAHGADVNFKVLNGQGSQVASGKKRGTRHCPLSHEGAFMI